MPLSEEETKDFLTTGILNVHLATVNGYGHANVHPAWYYYDRLNDKIYVQTSKQSKKYKKYSLKKNENIYFCIDDPNPPYKGVSGRGTVNVSEDFNFNVPIGEKILIKYMENLEHAMAQGLLDLHKKGQYVVLEITPRYYSTWDFSKQ
jgi:general stress protein 26